MLTPEERIQLIEARLTRAFSPCTINVIDDSHLHKGHEGAKSGASHFTLEICSETLSHLNRVAQHRAIYQQLSDLIPVEIHALKIVIIPT